VRPKLVLLILARAPVCSPQVSCARRTGAKTYEDVASHAFGKTARLLTVMMLFALTFLCCVAYMILSADLITPLLLQFGNIEPTPAHRSLLCAMWILLVSPFCFMRTVSGLKANGMISVTSVLFIAVAVAIRAIERITTVGMPEISKDLIYFAGYRDALFSFPIIGVSFLCQFNILPVHEELQEPSRRRLKMVIHSTIGFCTLLYTTVATLGYILAAQNPSTFPCGQQSCHGVPGDILQVMATSDPLANVGRAGLSLALLMSYPLLVLPCRNSLQRLVFLLPQYFRDVFQGQSSERQPFIPATPVQAKTDRTGTPSQLPLPQHVGITMAILFSVLVVALMVSEITVIWSLMGSSMSLIVAFVLPCACYLKIRSRKGRNWRRIAAWCLMIAAIVACLLCTYLSVVSITENNR
jgi:amino acid permease